MHFNIHTHTTRCNHASGNDREYVEQAIKFGIKTLGFSDHAPYYFPDGYYSGFRMNLNLVNDYFNSINELKNEYKNDIQIFVGLETEYYPKHFDAFLDIVEPFKPDYLILGQHFTKNEYDGHYCGAETSDVSVLKDYVSQSIEALKTGKFTYFAHPDLINFKGDEDIYLEEMAKLCMCAFSMNIPLEINMLGLREGRAYPRINFFKLASKIGNKAILGADAHAPQYVYHAETINKAKNFAQEAGIELLDSIDIRSLV